MASTGSFSRGMPTSANAKIGWAPMAYTSEMALVAAMRPKSYGSSTIGVKKSVVATMAWLSFSRNTAASSLVSMPTSRSFGRVRSGVRARISESTAGAILQPQPPPWLNSVRRIGRFSGAFIWAVETGSGRLEYSTLYSGTASVRYESSVNLAQLDDFDEVVDVRSPAEYAIDHVPGAVNCPVLSNEERVRVGTVYKQISAFEARRIGAALVAKNVARHLETHFATRDQGWKPLIYCWRGGQRSGSMTLILREIGWDAASLQGGYRSYRRAMLAQLEELPMRYDFRVISGPTGSGKSRLLQTLAARGAQALDLEALARHRGSVLGDLPEIGRAHV